MRVRLVFTLISASEFGVGSVPDCRAFPKLAPTKRTCPATHLDSRPRVGARGRLCEGVTVWWIRLLFSEKYRVFESMFGDNSNDLHIHYPVRAWA